MAIAIDGSVAPDFLPAMPCGGVPVFDDASGYAYRCDKCNAVIGSVAQPKRCVEINRSARSSEKTTGL